MVYLRYMYVTDPKYNMKDASHCTEYFFRINKVAYGFDCEHVFHSITSTYDWYSMAKVDLSPYPRNWKLSHSHMIRIPCKITRTHTATVHNRAQHTIFIMCIVKLLDIFSLLLLLLLCALHYFEVASNFPILIVFAFYMMRLE